MGCTTGGPGQFGGEGTPRLPRCSPSPASTNLIPPPRAPDQGNKYSADIAPTATVRAIFAGVGEGAGGLGFVEEASAATGVVGVVLDTSPFYAEQGGQVPPS